MTEFLEKINKAYQEIKEIKSEECIMDYDSKTEIINARMRAIELLTSTTALAMSGGVVLGKPTS